MVCKDLTAFNGRKYNQQQKQMSRSIQAANMCLLSNRILFKGHISTLVFSKSLNIGATATANSMVQRDHKILACQGKRASQLTEQLVYELLLGGNCGVTLVRGNISFF